MKQEDTTKSRAQIIAGFLAGVAVPALCGAFWNTVVLPLTEGRELSTSSLLVVSILCLSLGFLLGLLRGRAWSGREIERIPPEYTFERKGAILKRGDVELCSKCFFQHRREIPLKENQGSKILECVADINHQYARWAS
jgi:hypothetical protein